MRALSDTPSTPITRQAFYRFGQATVQYPILFITLSFVLVLIATAGIVNLGSTPDSRIFFSADNPHLQSLQYLEETFSRSDNVYIAIHNRDGTLFQPEILSLILEVTEASWQVPFSNRVSSLANFQYVSADDDTIIVRDLIESDVLLTDAYAQRIEQYVMNKPSILGQMVSRDGTVTGVNITLQKPDNNPHAVFEVMDYINELIAEFSTRYPQTEFYVTGGAAFDVAFTNIPAQENLFLGPLMVFFILVILYLTLRSVWFVFGTVLLIGMSVGVMLGVTGWVGAKMNAGTAGAPVIVLTLAVAYCVHVLVSVRQQLLSGVEFHSALVESIRINFAPVAITGITTAIGFLTLNFSDAPPFRQLGNMVAVGVLTTFILSVTFLPAFLSIRKIRLQPGPSTVSDLFRALANVVTRFHYYFLVLGILLITAIGFGAFRIVLDDNFIEYFDKRYALREATDFVEENLTGINALEYAVKGGESGSVMDPAYLQTVERFESWLLAQPKVTSTVSIVEVLRDLNRSMHNDNADYYRIPETRELAAQLILLYEMSLPIGQDMTHQMDIDKSVSKVVALVRGASSADLRHLNAKAEKWLAENTALPAIEGSGLSLIFAHISGRNIEAMLFGSLFALVLISMILVIALKSIRFGLLSLVPNLVPAVVGLGIWGYWQGTAGLSVAVVVAITLGIVVDDTVHFLSKYLRARRELALDAQQAVHYAFGTVGVAVWITSVTLVIGFLVLSLSGFKVTAEMGLLSAVTIASALIVDLLLLPPLLLIFDR